MSPLPEQLRLGIALEGTGWHPASWREPSARPSEVFAAEYWTDVVGESDNGLVDFVTFEDSMGLQSSTPGHPDDRVDQLRGRLDAVLIAARVAPRTRSVGLVPTATISHTEPFHISKAIASLDFVSGGRAGWRAQLSRPHEDTLFGRRRTPPGLLERRDSPEARALSAERFDEAADFIEVARRLWDSWEDDAEIRDVATGRFVDRAKLHYIDFRGNWFSVRGPSITPRPPQGQPVVAVLAHSQIPYRLAGRAADIVFTTPTGVSDAARITGEILSERAAVDQSDPIHVFGDLVTFLDDTSSAAHRRRERLDSLAGYPYVSDAAIFTGTPDELAEELVKLQAAGLTGFRLRPATIPHDLHQIVRGVVPALQKLGAVRAEPAGGSLRSRLGLARPASRYARA